MFLCILCCLVKPYPPYNLSVEKMDNQAYNLSWEMAVINKYYEIETKYQILYWKTNEPFKVSHNC